MAINSEKITTDEMISERYTENEVEQRSNTDCQEIMKNELSEVKYIRGFNGCLPSRSLNSTPIQFAAKFSGEGFPVESHHHFQPIQDIMMTDSEENLFVPISSGENNAFSPLTGSSSSLSSTCSEMEMSWGSTMSEIMRARKREKSVGPKSRSLDSSPILDQGFLCAVWVGKSKKSERKVHGGKHGTRRNSEYQRLDSTSSTDSGWSFCREDELALSRTSSTTSLSSSSELDFSWGSTMSDVLRARRKSKAEKKSPKPMLKLCKGFDEQVCSRSQGSTPLLLSSGDEMDDMNGVNPLDLQLRQRESHKSTGSMSDVEFTDGKPGLINILKARYNHLNY